MPTTQDEQTAGSGLSPFGHFVRRRNIPNVLTIIRIALIPVFLWLTLGTSHWADTPQQQVQRWWALAVFVLLMTTDQLDGFLARKYGVITDFGKLADPIADKALMISALVSLNLLGELWWSVTGIILLRELGITVWRIVLARRGKVVPASKGGKLKTVLQTAAVATFILPLGGSFDTLKIALMALAVAVTVITGLQYLWDSREPQH